MNRFFSLSCVLELVIISSRLYGQSVPVETLGNTLIHLNTDSDKHVQYKEGSFIGYSYYDTKKVEPMFPFGFGVSYTTFAYSNLKVDLNQ